MTTRTRFNKKKLWITMVALGFFLLGTAAAIVAAWGAIGLAPYYAMLPGIVPFGLLLVYEYYFAFICPRCGGNLGAVVVQCSASLFRMDDRFKYCPFCGCQIDE